MRTTEFTSPQHARWALLLSEHKFTIEYRKGTSHINAEALSRLEQDKVEEDCSPDDTGEEPTTSTKGSPQHTPAPPEEAQPRLLPADPHDEMTYSKKFFAPFNPCAPREPFPDSPTSPPQVNLLERDWVYRPELPELEHPSSPEGYTEEQDNPCLDSEDEMQGIYLSRQGRPVFQPPAPRIQHQGYPGAPIVELYTLQGADKGKAKVTDSWTYATREDSGPTVDSDLACEKCGYPDAEHLMVLCDGCQKGTHTYCMSPPISEVPTGSYWCRNCQEHRAIMLPPAGDMATTQSEDPDSGLATPAFSKEASTCSDGVTGSVPLDDPDDSHPAKSGDQHPVSSQREHTIAGGATTAQTENAVDIADDEAALQYLAEGMYPEQSAAAFGAAPDCTYGKEASCTKRPLPSIPAAMYPHLRRGLMSSNITTTTMVILGGEK